MKVVKSLFTKQGMTTVHSKLWTNPMQRLMAIDIAPATPKKRGTDLPAWCTTAKDDSNRLSGRKTKHLFDTKGSLRGPRVASQRPQRPQNFSEPLRPGAPFSCYPLIFLRELIQKKAYTSPDVRCTNVFQPHLKGALHKGGFVGMIS